jgi:nitrogen regulatory protein PII
VELGYAPKAKIEIACRDEDIQGIVQTIRASAHTGRHGDGKIFVTDVTHDGDVRTGAEGESIL